MFTVSDVKKSDHSHECAMEKSIQNAKQKIAICWERGVPRIFSTQEGKESSLCEVPRWKIDRRITQGAREDSFRIFSIGYRSIDKDRQALFFSSL